MEPMSKRSNKYKICLFVCLLLFLSGSCTQTEVEKSDISLHVLKDVDAGFHLNVLASRTPLTRSILFTATGTMESDSLTADGKGQPDTRAASPLDVAQESLIAGIWVGQYTVSDGTLLYDKYFSSLTGKTVNIKLKQDRNGAESHVWFVANVGDLGKIGTETELKEHLLSYASTATGLPESNLCGMVGMWKGVVQEGGMKDIEVKLTRLLAKISFTYSIGGEGFTFTPTVVALNSVPQKIGIDVPEGQQEGMTYTNYEGIAQKEGATMYWYLPENMAGTTGSGDTVDSEKKKTGKGVSNATYIELTGTAVQDKVTYNNVVFRFYPGSGMNNYDIERNCHYKMEVKLVGIDISDERITVNEIPPIVVDPEKMPAEKGGIKEVQITARPGQEWSFDIEEWLSAVINGKTAGTGTQVTYQGPALVTFQAVSANPKAEDRSVGFSLNVNGEEQAVTITQSGSTLVKGNDISLGAASGSEGSSSFTVTKGLQWLAALSGEDWWSWAEDNPDTSGNESSGEEQMLKVKATANNPFKTERNGRITVSAGASVGDPEYTRLKKEITVKQAASTVQGSEVNVTPEASVDQVSTFTATPGLEWVSKVTTGDWITLSGTTSGNQTTGLPQNITFNVKVNPSSTMRSGQITVRAGDETDGPTGTITVKQSGSSFSVSESVIELPYTASSGSVTINGTSGLLWTVQPSVTTNGITPGKTSDTTNGMGQTLAFNATENKGGARSTTFTVAVSGGNHSKTVEVKQIAGSAILVTIDQSILSSLRSVSSNMTVRPPFDEDGTNKYHGCAVNENAGTMTGSYVIQVQKGQLVEYGNYTVVKSYCRDLNEDGLSGWRLPTLIELWGIYKNKTRIASSTGASAFSGYYYWTSSTFIRNGDSGYRSLVSIPTGEISGCSNIDYDECIRCVRDI